MNIGSLIASIGGDMTPLQTSLKQAKAEMDKADQAMSQSMNNFSTSIKKAGDQMQKFGKMTSLYLTAPLVAAGGYAIKMASDYEESINKVDVAFKDNSKQVKDWAKTTLKSFGIAEGTALDMAALFGDMGTSMGFSTDAAAAMSTQLVGLAGDLASFKNIGIEQATTALNGVFTGETESLKRLGVVMTESNLSAFALSEGIRKNYQDMSQAEKVLLRYKYIMAMTTNAQGDFERTQGGAANQMRIFKESIKQLSVSFGQVLLPLFTKIIKAVNEWILKFAELSPTTKKLILIFAGIAAAIGPVSIALGAVLKLIPLIAAGGRLVMSGWFPVIAVITAVAGAFFLVKKWQDEAARAADEISDIYAGRSLENLKETLAYRKKDLEILEEEQNILEKTKGTVSGWFGGRDQVKETKNQIRYLEMAIEKKEQAIQKEKEFKEDLAKTNAEFGKMPKLDWNMPGMDFEDVGGRQEAPKEMKMIEWGTEWQKNLHKISGITGVVAEPLQGLTKDIHSLNVAIEDYGMGVENTMKSVDSSIKGTLYSVREIILDTNIILETLAETMVTSLAESIGNVIGGGSFKEGMQSFLNSIADWAIQLGKIMIAAGIALTEFWEAIKVKPWLAVGLGAMLVIAGTAVKKATANNPGSGGGYSGGGGAPGVDGMDLSKQRKLLEFNVNVSGEIRAQGNELVTIIENENKRRTR